MVAWLVAANLLDVASVVPHRMPAGMCCGYIINLHFTVSVGGAGCLRAL